MPKAIVSKKVDNVKRAGRAPYNFVPLSAERWKSVAAPPSHDRYDPDLFTGEIAFDFEALTDFYVRGMWKLNDYPPEKAERQKRPLTEPFQVDGKLMLPGSSMRGMIRQLVEILAASPIDRINKDYLFYRTVASVPDPTNTRSFEPHALAYKSAILNADRTELAVSAGYLTSSRDGWSIQPARKDRWGHQFYQYYRHSTTQKWFRDEVKFDPPDDRRFPARVHDGGHEDGWLVCSGWISGKLKQWVVNGPDPAAERHPIPSDDVKAYKTGGITKELIKNGFVYGESSRPLPCFYIMWQDPAGEQRTAFGHTPFFRIPYKRRPDECIPPIATRKKRESEWDLTDAMFGHVPKDSKDTGRKAWRGRVSFDDATLSEASPADVEASERRVVLGQPKPTTYQHYAVQVSELVKDALHWDGDYKTSKPGCIRGHKLYWHRKGARMPEMDPSKGDNVASLFRPVKEGARFSPKIRFENLRCEELGALLTAVQLHPDCAHRLGLAKPLGLGSFRVQNVRLTRIVAAKRYESFLSDGKLTTGARDLTSEIGNLRLSFMRWYLAQTEATEEHFWREPRIKELKAILTWVERSPEEQAKWLGRTRYLEFGRMEETYNQGRNYNEYQEVGFPDQVRPELQKRRPLPPASQVLEGGPSLPDTPRPDFAPPRTQEERDREAPRKTSHWR